MGCQESDAVKTKHENKEERKEISIHNENENNDEDWDPNNLELPRTCGPTMIIPKHKK